MSMDWTPEQIAAACDAYAEQDGQADSYAMQCALSAVDLSDHDRAVAADALRKAADAAADNCASVLNDDDPTEANRWADTEHWLRARAEERVPDPAPVTPDVTPGNPDTPKRREPLNPGWDRYDREG